MAKFKFESLEEFKDYVERYFSKQRDRNAGNDRFEFDRLKQVGDVAYLVFDVNPQFEALAMAVRVPAKDTWLCWFPKFSHHGLDHLSDVLGDVNNGNHELRPEKHPASSEKLEDEEGFDEAEWETQPF